MAVASLSLTTSPHGITLTFMIAPFLCARVIKRDARDQVGEGMSDHALRSSVHVVQFFTATEALLQNCSLRRKGSPSELKQNAFGAGYQDADKGLYAARTGGGSFTTSCPGSNFIGAFSTWTRP